MLHILRESNSPKGLNGIHVGRVSTCLRILVRSAQTHKHQPAMQQTDDWVTMKVPAHLDETSRYPFDKGLLFLFLSILEGWTDCRVLHKHPLLHNKSE